MNLISSKFGKMSANLYFASEEDQLDGFTSARMSVCQDKKLIFPKLYVLSNYSDKLLNLNCQSD